jgi:hypothetical protein
LKNLHFFNLKPAFVFHVNKHDNKGNQHNGN